MNHLVTCTCGQVIVKSVDGKTKVSSKVLILTETGAVAVCKSCSNEIPVPVNLDVDLMKSMSSTKYVPLYLRDIKKSS